MKKNLTRLASFAIAFFCALGCSDNKSADNESDINQKAVDVIYDYVEETTTPEQIATLQEELQNLIQYFIDEKYTNIALYTKEDYHIPDFMIFNKDGDKVILFLTVLLKDKDDAIVKMYTGRYQDNRWDITDGGIPQFYSTWDSESFNGVPFTHKQVLDRALSYLANHGLVKNSRKIDHDYLNYFWF